MRKELLYVPFVLLFVAACSKDSALLPVPEADNDVLQLLSAATDEAAEIPRTIITTTNLDNLRLYATTTGGAAYVGNSGRAFGDYAKTGGTWSTTGTAQIKINSDACVYAVYPAGTTISQTGTTSPQASVNILTADNFVAAGQTDYLYSNGYQTVHSANHKVSFSNMKHALAKVSFKITKMGAEDMTLTKVEIREKNRMLLAGNGNMNITDGTFSGGLGGVEALTLTGSVVLTAAEDLSGPNVTCLAVPVNGMNGLSFRLTIRVGAETRTLETDVLSSAQQWEKSIHYVYAISVGKGQVEFKNMRIYDWMDDATTSVGIQ